MNFTLMASEPPARIHDLLVTRTWELARHLKDIRLVEVEEQWALETGWRGARHAWHANIVVPPLLAPHVDGDYFAWTAAVEWREDNFHSHWRITPRALDDSLSCTADILLNEALGGKGTRVLVDLQLHGLENRQGVETIAMRVVSVNWHKLIAAAGALSSR